MRAKKLIPATVALAIVALFGATLWFLYAKSRPKAVGVETEKPVVTDIVKKCVAAGAIQPRKEIEIKPKVSGILKALYVEAGQKVKKGDLIAEVQIIPEMLSLNEAELKLSSGKLTVDRTRRELDRAEALNKNGAAAVTELDKLRADYAQAVQELKAAEMRVQLVREGEVGPSRAAGTRVECDVHDTVLTLRLRQANALTQQNNVTRGTAIATVIDMADMVVKGGVAQSDVGNLDDSMPLEIIIDAHHDLR